MPVVVRSSSAVVDRHQQPDEDGLELTERLRTGAAGQVTYASALGLAPMYILGHLMIVLAGFTESAVKAAFAS